MAITATPLWVEGLATHSAQDYRRLLEGIFSYKPGIFLPTDFAVTTNNNMTVTVAAGMAIVDGTEDANQGLYFVHADSSTIVSVDAAHATLNRLDFVVLRVRDDFYATGPDEGVDIFIVKGTPASSPAEPTLPDNVFVLARLSIVAADSVIATGDITDRRTTTTGQSGQVGLMGAFRSCTSITRPTAGLVAYKDFIVESNTGRMYVWNGTAWAICGGFSAGTRIGCEVYSTVAQSMPTVNWTEINMNIENYDSDAFHSTVSNTNRITIPTGLEGVYTVTFYFEDSVGGQMAINKNGNRVMRKGFAVPLDSLSWTGYLAAGDWVGASFYNGGATRNHTVALASADGPASPSITAYKVT